MTTFGSILVVATTLLALSCSKAPTAPGYSVVPHAATTEASSASQTWTRAAVAVDSIVPCACLGEPVHFLGEYAFQYHFVESGSGSFHIDWHATPSTPATGTPLSAHGETSGKIFVNVASPVTQTSELGQRIQVVTLVDRERYVADDGARLLVTYRVHTTAEGNGHLIVEKAEPWSIACSK